MSNLKDLVPPLELCKLIPAGEFEDSALAWIDFRDVYPEENANPSVVVRKIAWAATSKKGVYPAPTLHEIMAELPACDCYRFSDKNEWTVLLVNGPVDGGVKSDSPAAAALKLWLKLKGIEDGE
jgi:hypothetical protein